MLIQQRTSKQELMQEGRLEEEETVTREQEVGANNIYNKQLRRDASLYNSTEIGQAGLSRGPPRVV
jgi:hypothetical protein